MPNFTAGTSFTDGVTNDVTALKLNALVADAVPTSSLALTSTSGTISNFTSSTANITLGTIPTLTAGTTTGTAGVFTSGTVTTLNSTTGTITNLSTTLAGDLTISQGTATLGTTGATAATYGTTSAIPRITVDAKGRVTAASTVNAPVGFRNRIINGDMAIDQRSGGTAYAITSSLYGSCDRWGSLAGANGVWSQQRVTTGSTDFPFAMRVQRTAGSTSTAVVYVGQVIETANCQDLAGQSVTVSFYATAGANFSASGSAITCQVYTGTGSDQGWTALNSGNWSGGASSISSSQAITTTRTRYSFTGSIPAGTNEIVVRFDATGTGTAGANDWFQITGVQLEVGSTATDFERRPIGTELALCQRYCPVFSGSDFIFASGFSYAATNSIVFLNYPVQVRTPATGLVGSGVFYTLNGGASGVTVTALTINNSNSLAGIQLNCQVASGLTLGQGTMLGVSGAGKIIMTGCEL